MPVSTRRLLKILEAVGRDFTFSDLLTKVGLSESTAKRYVNEMVRQGLVKVVEGRYVATDRGLFLLEGMAIGRKQVKADMAYLFTNDEGLPVPLRVDSIEKLYIVAKYGLVPEDLLHHHIAKRYIARWLSEVIGAKILAQRVSQVSTSDEFIKILEDYLSQL